MPTKLQIVELNEKDVRDTLLLFHGHPLANNDREAVNAQRIAELCAEPWGVSWRTITKNLSRCVELLPNYSLPEAERARIESRLLELNTRLDEVAKSRSWKLRARIGERKRWYELPEEVDP